MHLVLLGVDSVPKAARFYEALGWKKSPTGNDGFVKFDMGGYALCLINRADLAKDALEPEPEKSGFSGIALIHLAQNAEDVPRILARAVEAGGSLVKPATRTDWGSPATSRTRMGICSKWTLKQCGCSTMRTVW